MHTTPYSRPTPGTLTAQVWDVADQISRDTGRRANRKEVIARIVALGGNENTASTQYHHWKAHREAKQAHRPPVSPNRPAGALEIQKGGILVLPVEVLAAMRAKAGDRVTAKVVDGELKITTAAGGDLSTASHRF